ncbi:hypothetical protein BgAZ_110360 [Babesia gibsoni]|uniref:Uncharacterized protein n=1 Tax=Babesia gibsoni TaxID=33632 RepID=A0AAD8PH37_BABGI|nr:hypothetical protein BgAZ_110360 [Babesia gibsoni]
MAVSDKDIPADRYLKTFQKHEQPASSNSGASVGVSELSQLAGLKSDLDTAIGRIRPYLQNKSPSEAEWRTIIELRQETKAKLATANAKINNLTSDPSPNGDRVMVLQLQRYRRIFDQMSGDFNIISKQLDQRYQSFRLFNDNRHITKPRGSAIDGGKVVVEAIMDVESLTEQASLNLTILKQGNDRMLKIYNRLNTMVNEHLFDIHKLQKNINYVLIRNRTVTSVVMGVCLFIVIEKLILSKIV